MPLVTVTLQQKRPLEFKSAILDAVHRSLVANGVLRFGVDARAGAIGAVDVAPELTARTVE